MKPNPTQYCGQVPQVPQVHLLSRRARLDAGPTMYAVHTAQPWLWRAARWTGQTSLTWCWRACGLVGVPLGQMASYAAGAHVERTSYWCLANHAITKKVFKKAVWQVGGAFGGKLRDRCIAPVGDRVTVNQVARAASILGVDVEVMLAALEEAAVSLYNRVLERRAELRREGSRFKGPAVPLVPVGPNGRLPY